MITGKLYNVLKFLALVVFPALGTLYATLAALWGLPAAEAVVGSIVALDTFLGIILQISSSNYNSSTASGTLGIHESEEGKTYHLNINDDPELELDGKERVVFMVKKTKDDPPRPTPKKKAAPRRRQAEDA